MNNRQSFDKKVIEITTLLLSNDEKEFKTMFKKKFKQLLSDLNKPFNESLEDIFSDFDKKVLNFNLEGRKNDN